MDSTSSSSMLLLSTSLPTTTPPQPCSSSNPPPLPHSKIQVESDNEEGDNQGEKLGVSPKELTESFLVSDKDGTSKVLYRLLDTTFFALIPNVKLHSTNKAPKDRYTSEVRQENGKLMIKRKARGASSMWKDLAEMRKSKNVICDNESGTSVTIIQKKRKPEILIKSLNFYRISEKMIICYRFKAFPSEISVVRIDCYDPSGKTMLLSVHGGHTHIYV